MSVEVATDDEQELGDEKEEDTAWKEFHRYQCFFAKCALETEQVRKWKVNKTGRGKANLQKRGKVIRYNHADQTTQNGLDATMLKEWNKWKEFNEVSRISKEDA